MALPPSHLLHLRAYLFQLDSRPLQLLVRLLICAQRSSARRMACAAPASARVGDRVRLGDQAHRVLRAAAPIRQAHVWPGGYWQTPLPLLRRERHPSIATRCHRSGACPVGRPLRSTENTSGGSENVHWRAAPSSEAERVQRLQGMPIPSQPSRTRCSDHTAARLRSSPPGRGRRGDGRQRAQRDDVTQHAPAPGSEPHHGPGGRRRPLLLCPFVQTLSTAAASGSSGARWPLLCGGPNAASATCRALAHVATSVESFTSFRATSAARRARRPFGVRRDLGRGAARGLYARQRCGRAAPGAEILAGGESAGEQASEAATAPPARQDVAPSRAHRERNRQQAAPLQRATRGLPVPLAGALPGSASNARRSAE